MLTPTLVLQASFLLQHDHLLAIACTLYAINADVARLHVTCMISSQQSGTMCWLNDLQPL